MNIHKTNKFVRYALMSTLFASAFVNQSNSAKSEATGKADNKQATFRAVPTKTAYVYLGKIMTVDEAALPTVSVEWRDLFGKLQQTLAPINSELQELEEQYKKGRTDFESLQKSGLSSREALQRKAEELGKIEYELRGRMEERERFAQGKLNEMQAILAPKIEVVLKQIKQSQGWDVVERGESALLISPEFDLTQQVLDQLNKEYSDAQKAKKQEDEKATVKPAA